MFTLKKLAVPSAPYRLAQGAMATVGEYLTVAEAVSAARREDGDYKVSPNDSWDSHDLCIRGGRAVLPDFSGDFWDTIGRAMGRVDPQQAWIR